MVKNYRQTISRPTRRRDRIIDLYVRYRIQGIINIEIEKLKIAMYCGEA
jgi:hypothetical protein